MKTIIAVIAMFFSVVSLGMDGEQGAGPVRNGDLGNHRQQRAEGRAAPYYRIARDLFGAKRSSEDQAQNECIPGPTFAEDQNDPEPKMESSSDDEVITETDQDFDIAAFTRGAVAGTDRIWEYQYEELLKETMAASSQSEESHSVGFFPFFLNQEEQEELGEDQNMADEE